METLEGGEDVGVWGAGGGHHGPEEGFAVDGGEGGDVGGGFGGGWGDDGFGGLGLGDRVGFEGW